MFDLEERLAEIDAYYAESKLKAQVIHKIGTEIKDLIPEGWRLWPSSGLHFSKYDSEAPAAEFRAVCHVLEKKLGVTLTRSGDRDGDLRGRGYYRAKEDELLISVEVTKTRGPDCKITWEEKLVKVATVDPACLGVHEEAGA